MNNHIKKRQAVPVAFLAETVGFEPTCGFHRKLISSQPRYDHFDTSPSMLFIDYSRLTEKIKAFWP